MHFGLTASMPIVLCYMTHAFRTRKVYSPKHSSDAVGTNESDLKNANDALGKASLALGISLDLAAPRDAALFRSEAQYCKESDCCICSGALLEPAAEILEEAADAVKDKEALIVIAKSGSSLSAFCWVSKDSDTLKVEWLCQRPPHGPSSKSHCEGSAPKSGQLAFASALVQGRASFDATTARLAVAGTARSHTNNAAVGLYCKYCFKHGLHLHGNNLAMENSDLAATVKLVPQLLATLMPEAQKGNKSPPCSCSQQKSDRTAPAHEATKPPAEQLQHTARYEVVRADHTPRAESGDFPSGDDYWDSYVIN